MVIYTIVQQKRTKGNRKNGFFALDFIKCYKSKRCLSPLYPKLHTDETPPSSVEKVGYSSVSIFVSFPGPQARGALRA